jgi:hypothetical protein
MTLHRDTAFLIRAQKLDAVAGALVSALQSAGVSPIVIADERGAAVDSGGLRKLSICEDALKDLGFEQLPENWGWFCGDLCYYLAASRVDAKRYCLIESDVFVPRKAAARFVEDITGHNASALAVNLKPKLHKKRYAAGLKTLGFDAFFGCIFPVTAVSQSVVHDMQGFRKDALKKGIALNDEAILTGTIQKHGHTYAALEEEFPSSFDPAYFQTNPPHLFESVSSDGALDSLAHPVVTLETVLSRIETGEKAYTRHRLRKVLKTCTKPTKHILKEALAMAEAKSE